MTNSLWDFALDFYARPGVQAACLRLQDAGSDVCLLLAGIWLQRRGVACTPARLDALQALSAPWQAQVVQPLRDLRRAWKSAAAEDDALDELRHQLASLELRAERVQLERLQALAQDWPADATDADDWLRALDALDEAVLVG